MKFRKYRILVAEARELIGQQANCLGIQALLGGASAVNFAQHQKIVQRPFARGHPETPNIPSINCSGLFHPPARLPHSRMILESVLVRKNVLPDIQISRDVRLAVRIQLKPRDEKKKTLVRTERMLGWARGNILLREALHKSAANGAGR